MIAAWLHVSIRVSQSGRNEAIGVHSMRGETALRSRSSTWGLRGRPLELTRQAGGHWFEPSTAHLHGSPAKAAFLSLTARPGRLRPRPSPTVQREWPRTWGSLNSVVELFKLPLRRASLSSPRAMPSGTKYRVS